MSQTENAVTSSSGAKRAYRKGKPLSEAERQRAASARKRSVCKEIKVFVRPELKNYLTSLCAKAYRERGLSQEHDVMGSHSC